VTSTILTQHHGRRWGVRFPIAAVPATYRRRQAAARLLTMRSSGHSAEAAARSGVGDAIGSAATYPVRAAARAWRGPLEAAAEEVLATPEVRRILDHALAGPLPEELARSLVRHRVLERVVEELAETGELQRLFDTALDSPRALELVDRALASEAMQHALRRALAGPELRDAMASQSAGLVEQVAASVRRAANGLDRRLWQIVHGRSAAAPERFAGVVGRGTALVVDALAIAAVSFAVSTAAGLVAWLVGGLQPHWLAGLLLGIADAVVAVGYFTLFWATAGQTPGMRLMHVRVHSQRAGGRVTFGWALLRTLGLFLAAIPCFLGFVPALFDRRGRALPDYLAGTVVLGDDD
jgi:uncharacterized RDD family membrane protein YckC